MSDEDPVAREDTTGDPSSVDSSSETNATGGASREAATDAGGVDQSLGSSAGVIGESEYSQEVLRLELERLRERNERLRETFARAKKAEYRSAALGMGVVGSVAIATAALLPVVRTILLVLGATGLFGAVLTYYLTPQRFVAADVGRGVYRAMSEDRSALVTELGLADKRVYIPVDEANSRVRLFVPQFEAYDIPPEEELDSVLVVPGDEAGRGVSFTPTGEDLYESFAEAVSGNPETDPRVVTTRLCDALVEQFELVDATEVDYDTAGRQLTVSVEGSVYGSGGGVDQPVVSVLAVGLARVLERPVRAEVAVTDGEDTDFVVTYRWDAQTEG